MEKDREVERAANPAPERTDVGCDKVNQIVGARASSDGCVDYFVHWAKLDGEEYPMDTCTWEQRDQPGVKESSLDESFLMQMHVELTTAKRSSEGNITEYDRSKKKFKVETDNGKEIWKSFHKPDKNHSWMLSGFELNDPQRTSKSESEDSESEDSESEPDSTPEPDSTSEPESEPNGEATQEMIQPPSDSDSP